MKLVIPEISWHNRDPVLSVHFQPTTTEDGYCRLATGGSDSHVFVSNFTSTMQSMCKCQTMFYGIIFQIWRIKVDDSNVNVEFAADLTKHQKAVNAVRFSPDAQWLASGDDGKLFCVSLFILSNSYLPC